MKCIRIMGFFLLAYLLAALIVPSALAVRVYHWNDAMQVYIDDEDFQLGSELKLTTGYNSGLKRDSLDSNNLTQEVLISDANGNDLTGLLTDQIGNTGYEVSQNMSIFLSFSKPTRVRKILVKGKPGSDIYNYNYFKVTSIKARFSESDDWVTMRDYSNWDYNCCDETGRTDGKSFWPSSYDPPEFYRYWKLELEYVERNEENPYPKITEIEVEGNYIDDVIATTSLDFAADPAPDSFGSIETFSIEDSSLTGTRYLINMDFGQGEGWYYYDGSRWILTDLEEISRVGMTVEFMYDYRASIVNKINQVIADKYNNGEGNSIPIQIALFASNSTRLQWIEFEGPPLELDPSDIETEISYIYQNVPADVKLKIEKISNMPCSPKAVTIDWGDNNSETFPDQKHLNGFTAQHTYNNPGTYTANLTVELVCISATKPVSIEVLDRKQASIQIEGRKQDSYAPLPYQFSAQVVSDDPRNKKGIASDSDVNWTIKKDGEIVAELTTKQLSTEYTFEEGGTYNILVEADTLIGTHATGTATFEVPPRAEATFNIKARKRSAYAPAPCNFSAVLTSDDKRNRGIASDISWTITKDGNVIASLTGEKPKMEYTFEEGGTYNILVEADTPIGTHATGSSTIEVLPRAEVNLNAKIKKRFFPGKVTIRPSLSSDDKRNRRISYCTVQVFDPDGEEIYNEKKERVLAPVIIDLNEKPGNYIAKVSVVTSIGTETTKDFPFEFTRAPASAGVTVKTRYPYVPAELQIRRKITSVDSRNRSDLVEERYEIWYHDEQNSTLIDTISLSPKNRGRITYTISSPGAYTVKYLATSQIGTQITGESSVFEIQDAAPITVTIKPACKPGIEGPVPIDCRFSAQVKSSDPRNKRITVSHWEVYKDGSDTPIVTLHKEGKEALRFKRFACSFTEPGTYTVKYIPTVETNFSAEGIAEVVALEPAAVDAEIVSKCKPSYAPSSCTFKASIIAADKRDKLSSCQWKVYKGDALLYETEPGRSTRLRYSFEEGGQYIIVFNAETKLGKTIEKQQVVEIGDRMPVALQIIPKLPRFNRPPAAYRFSLKSVSEDKRQRSIRDISVKILSPQGEEIYSSNRSSFSYTFTEPGCYTVKAEAVTSRLGTFVTGELPVTVDPNQLPEISKVVATQNRIRPMQYKFSVQAIDKDGKVRSYHWDFGDGSTADRKSVNHVYASPGTYTVTVEACDNSGECSNCQTQVHVGS